jgi:hypothetical protein
MDAVVAGRANPARVPSGLQRHSTDQALAGELAALLVLEEQGLVFSGSPTLAPEVRAVELDTGRVVIQDCQDNTNWIPVDRESGDSRAAPDQRVRIWVDVTVRPMGDRLMVVRVKSDRDREC